MARFRVGEEVWLVPTLITAPRDAYRTPQVVIKHLWAEGARATVILRDGREIETDTRNLATEAPGLKTRAKNLVIRPKMPDGFEEQPLW